MSKIICKCCGKNARWCGEGKKACGIKECDHIHCDHCGMHYSLESTESAEASTVKEAKKIMLRAYSK